MAKFPTYPTLYDDLKTVSISFLTKHGYFKPNQCRSGTIKWSRNGNKTASISIVVNTKPESNYLELDYKYNEAPINYRVQLVSAPSNLGKGVVWYFVCPRTGRRCRKLYLMGGYFFHREAFNGCMYESQTRSKEYRRLDKTLGAYFNSDKLYRELYKKHFKKKYAGKPTKKYLRIMAQLNKIEYLSHLELERLMICSK